MTTAHRPTFDPARGKDAQRGPAYHQRLLPAHKTLKYRQAAQGTEAETAQRDLRAELLRAEKVHYARKAGRELSPEEEDTPQAAIEAASPGGRKRSLDATQHEDEEEETFAAKRARVLAETAALDASSSSEDEDDEDDDDEEDEESDDEDALLQAELAKVKRERAEQAAKIAAEQQARDEDARERDIALGNPLLRPAAEEYGVKRRWDDDVVFKNQARGESEKDKARGKEFVNDLLRSDFHRKFMSRYVR
ncbi:hypothetical protein ANO11243_052580 [Dothideomycetidae sp. 11243]|nr:hypothetical protein ANO11243_052580 [fungal sp. No.11243]